MKIQRRLMFSLLFLAVVAAPAYAEELGTGVTLNDLVSSSDVVISEKAQSGAAVAIVEHPEKIEGGIALAPQGLTMQRIIATWKANGKVGLSALKQAAGIGGGPPAAGIPDIITNGEFTTDLTGWTASNAIGGQTDFGPITAPVGSIDGRFAVAYTGPWEAATRGSIEQTNRVNTSATGTLSIVYNFVTMEYPKYVGTHFNDNMIVTVSDKTGSIQFALFQDVNTSTFTPVSGLPAAYVSAGGLAQDGGQTGWITVNSPQLFFNNGDYTVRIEVNDVGDAMDDSAILVDRIGLALQ